ncbi:MAG: BamA/TamA family outer membrane protein [Nitrospirae bacterium YQR-1]
MKTGLFTCMLLSLVCILFIRDVEAEDVAEKSSIRLEQIPDVNQSERLLPLPGLKENKNEPAFELPDAAEEPDKGDLSSAVSIYIRKITFRGGTVFSEKEIDNITNPYINRNVSFMKIEKLRRTLSELYTKRGYVNSGVIIPDQKVKDGELVFQATEGRLSEIAVEGNKQLSKTYIADRIRLHTEEPLNVGELQTSLRLLLQSPSIKDLRAELLPAIGLGESVLKIKVEENRPFTLVIEGGNNHSTSIGSYGGDVYASYRNLFRAGDAINGSFTLSEGLRDGTAEYVVPLSARDTLLKIQYRQNTASIIEAPFEKLEIKSRVKTYGMTVSHPLYKTPEKEINLGITTEMRQSETFLLGRRFSFSEGTDDGKAGVFALRTFQEWADRGQDHVLAARSTLSFGLRGFNSTINDSDTPDSRFITWLLQFQAIKRPFNTKTKLIFRTDLQLSNDRLLPMEKLAVGGMDSVRGYRKNILVRDNGLFSSIELRIPIYGTDSRPEVVEVAPFLDYASAWNTKSSTPEPRNISGAGVGIRWAVTSDILFQIYGAKAFRNVYTYEKDLQDKGVYFKLTARIF